MAGSRFFISTKDSLKHQSGCLLSQQTVLDAVVDRNARDAYRDLFDRVAQTLIAERRAVEAMLHDKHHFAFVTSVLFPLPRKKVLLKHSYHLKRLDELVRDLDELMCTLYSEAPHNVRDALINLCHDIQIASEAILNHQMLFNEKDGLKLILGGILFAAATLLFVATLPVSGVLSGIVLGFGVLLSLNAVLLIGGFVRECIRNTVLPVDAASAAVNVDKIGLPGLRYHHGQEQYELDLDLDEGVKPC